MLHQFWFAHFWRLPSWPAGSKFLFTFSFERCLLVLGPKKKALVDNVILYNSVNWCRTFKLRKQYIINIRIKKMNITLGPKRSPEWKLIYFVLHFPLFALVECYVLGNNGYICHVHIFQWYGKIKQLLPGERKWISCQ